MRSDNRLSVALHILLHLERHGVPVTSEDLAKAVSTNPVVIRRTLAGLRVRGYVHSEKGHGGGWTLSCDPAAVTLRDIYTALGSPALFAMGNRAEASGCMVEQAANAALGQAFHEAEVLLLQRFGEVTLAKLRDELQKRLTAHSGAHNLESFH